MKLSVGVVGLGLVVDGLNSIDETIKTKSAPEGMPLVRSVEQHMRIGAAQMAFIVGTVLGLAGNMRYIFSLRRLGKGVFKANGGAPLLMIICAWPVCYFSSILVHWTPVPERFTTMASDRERVRSVFTWSKPLAKTNAVAST